MKVERLSERDSSPQLDGFVIFWVVEGMDGNEKGFFCKEYDIMFTSGGNKKSMTIHRSPAGGLYIMIPNKIDSLHPAVVTTGEWKRIEASVGNYNSEV